MSGIISIESGPESNFIFARHRAWDVNTYYSQENNPTERANKKRIATSFLETCGPTTATMACDIIDRESVRIKTSGGYQPQPEEVLQDYFNDYRNYAKFTEIIEGLQPDQVMNNRYIQLYPLAIKEVFNIEATFVEEHLTLDRIKSFINDGILIMVWLVKPSHYVLIIGYADGKVIYNDPNPSRFKDGRNGFQRVMTHEDVWNNLHDKFILFHSSQEVTNGQFEKSNR
jgi:hypothetical protein